MEDIMWKAAFGSLGKALDDIAAAPEIESSPELRKRVADACDFYGTLDSLAADLVTALQTARETLDELTRDESTIRIGQRNYAKYANLAASGADAVSVCSTAIEDGLGVIGAVAALRAAFNMPLKEALRVKATVESDTRPDPAQ